MEHTKGKILKNHHIQFRSERMIVSKSRIQLRLLWLTLFFLAYSCLPAISQATTTCPAEGCANNLKENLNRKAPNYAWTNAFISVAVISTVGNIGILIYLFIDNQATGGWALKTMVGFAVGGLLGDVFLHLLPHSQPDDSHDISGGLWVLGGILSFFIVEKLVRLYHKEDNGNSHSHSHGGLKNKDEKSTSGIRPGAWLNLFADATHNFVDGMAIAAAYRTSNSLGNSTTLAVLLHEIPHEMGDFAVLLTQGFTRKGAFLCQFISALGAFAGCLFGLMISSQESEPKAVLNFTAGGFIYVALVDVLPELLDEQTSLGQIIRETLAFCLGVGVMIWVAAYEEHGHNHSHHDHSHSHKH